MNILTQSYSLGVSPLPIVQFKRPPLSIRRIQDVVADYYAVRRADILSRRRSTDVLIPRHVAMFLARELTPHSYPVIAKHFGDRDHTTVMSAVRRIEVKMCNPDFAENVNELREALAA